MPIKFKNPLEILLYPHLLNPVSVCFVVVMSIVRLLFGWIRVKRANGNLEISTDAKSYKSDLVTCLGYLFNIVVNSVVCDRMMVSYMWQVIKAVKFPYYKKDDWRYQYQIDSRKKMYSGYLKSKKTKKNKKWVRKP